MLVNIFESTIGLLIFCTIIIPFLINSKDTTKNTEEKIIFEFSRSYRIIMLICLIILASATIIITLINLNDKNIIIGTTIFMILTLICLIIYLSAKNKKVIYTNNTLYYFNLLGKKSIYSFNDIIQAIENPMDGINLKFKNNKIIKIDIQMSNYKKLKELLEKNNIKFTDKNNNPIPKGW